MLTGKQVAWSTTTPRGPSEKEKPCSPSRSTAARPERALVVAGFREVCRPVQKGASPSRHQSFSSVVISATMARARSPVRFALSLDRSMSIRPFSQGGGLLRIVIGRCLLLK